MTEDKEARETLIALAFSLVTSHRTRRSLCCFVMLGCSVKRRQRKGPTRGTSLEGVSKHLSQFSPQHVCLKA